MSDVVHGYRTIYPIPLGLGASFDPELVFECTSMAAREAAAGGIHVTFAPMVDYARDARWGRVMETFGEDPYMNSVMGATEVKAFQGNDLRSTEHIAACVKHFAAYGGVESGRDYNTVEISERLLREYYFPAYKACVDVGVAMVMPSFNSLNGVPATCNPWLMNDVLRDEWGFDARAAIIGQEYKAQPDTATDKALKRITADAAPSEAARNAGSQHPYSGFDAMADVKEPAALYYSPRGRDALPDAKKAEAVPLTPAQALRRLREMAPQAFLNNATGCRDLVTARHADAVPESALPDLAHALLQRFAPAVLTGPGSRVINLRAAANGGTGGQHAG